jgi:hypothetical protein
VVGYEVGKGGIRGELMGELDEKPSWWFKWCLELESSGVAFKTPTELPSSLI